MMFGWPNVLVLLSLLVAFGALPMGSGDPSKGARCDSFASIRGSDAWPGSRKRPFRTARRLVHSLHGGETGCLRAGTYSTDNQVKVSEEGITLASYPGERARLKARLWIAANDVTVQDLVLDGVNDDLFRARR